MRTTKTKTGAEMTYLPTGERVTYLKKVRGSTDLVEVIFRDSEGFTAGKRTVPRSQLR